MFMEFSDLKMKRNSYTGKHQISILVLFDILNLVNTRGKLDDV